MRFPSIVVGALADIALLVLRGWLGGVMLAHGRNHLRNVSGTASWFESIGFNQPRLVALGSGVGEVAIGAGLILGLLTSVAAAGLVMVMTIAFVVVHRKAGFFVFNRPDEGWEYVATLAVTAAVVAMLGPGRYAVDAVAGLELRGGPGMLIVVGGALLGGLMVAVSWRPGADE